MISVEGGRKMPCESCGVQFSLFRRKRACSECERLYCAACLRRGGGMCAPCRTLSSRPLQRAAIAHLKPRDLQCFLKRQNVSTRGCVEKEELVSLCVSHVNSSAYHRRGSTTGSRGSPGPFTTLKGFTNQVNDMINSAFDLRSSSQPQTQSNSNCYNAGHAHSAPFAPSAPSPSPPTAPRDRERFTVNPGGERDFREGGVFAGGGGGGGGSDAGSGHSESEGSRRDTADCFEVEDLDDSGWEFVTRPAEPLPEDSEVLIAPAPAVVPPPPGAPRSPPRGGRGRGGGGLLDAGGGGGGGTPQRAASELDLHRSESTHSAEDSTSLQDEPIMGRTHDSCDSTAIPEPVTLEWVCGAGGERALQRLSVRQLKELLARNRVEYRGCLERADLLHRATTLYRDHAKYKDEVEALPLEECCKICMAAPLECVLLECGHIAACTRCAKQLAECPICRQYVVRAVRFFRS